jgi:glutaredoxin
METEIKESQDADCCEKGACGCEKYKKCLPKIIAAVVLVVALCSYGYYKLVFVKHNLTEAQAKTKVEEFINKNLMQSGTKAKIASVTKENGMFKVMVEIGEGAQKQEITSYLSADGSKFFPSVMDIAETEKKMAGQAEAAAKPAAEIPKADKPTVDLYVMSFCPFGNKAEDTMKSVYDLLKNKVNFNFHYIVSSEGDSIKSLHGEKEVVQNEREACVLKDYGKDKWMGFVTYVNTNCGSDGACWETGAKSLGINVAKVTACVASNGTALMKADEKISAEAGASGSPTMTINGVETKAVYQYGNSEEYKKIICESFNKAPAECAKVLSSSTATAEGGSCGS